MTEWTKESRDELRLRAQAEAELPEYQREEVSGPEEILSLLDEIERLQGGLERVQLSHASLVKQLMLAREAHQNCPPVQEAVVKFEAQEAIRQAVEQRDRDHKLNIENLMISVKESTEATIAAAVEQEREACAVSQDELAAAFRRKAERADDKLRAIAEEMRAAALNVGAQRIRNRSQEGR